MPIPSLKTRFYRAHLWTQRAIRVCIDFLFPPDALDSKIHALAPEDMHEYLHPRTLPSGILVFFYYRDRVIRRMIALLKYRNHASIARLFGNTLADYLLAECAERWLFDNVTHPLIVPVPLSPERLRERGYNQAEVLARALITACPSLGELASDALERVRHTKAQTALPRAARIQNVRGAFRADRQRVRGRDIILLDDVTTTGSTLAEARTALRDAGARSVFAIALAH